MPNEQPYMPYFMQRPEDMERMEFSLQITDPRITMLHLSLSGARAEVRLREALSGELPVVGACYAYVCTAMTQEGEEIRASFQLRRLALPDQSPDPAP
jgi:hypothetical protein